MLPGAYPFPAASADYVFPEREPAYETGYHKTQDKGYGCSKNDRQWHRQQRVQETEDSREHQHVHQIYSVACLGDLTDQAIASACLADKAEEQENARAHETGYYGIVLQVHLQLLRGRYDKATVIELAHAEHIAGSQDRHAHCEDLAGGPVQVGPDIVSEYYIADKAGNIIEQRIGIPPAFAEEGAKDISEPVEAKRESPYRQEKELFFLSDLCQPRGNHRHHKIQSQHHVDEPKVRLARDEIDSSLLDVRPCLRPREFTPDGREERIQEQEHHERDTHTDETLPEERLRIRLHRHEQVGGSHEEQRHGYGAHEALDKHHATPRELRRKGKGIIVRIDALAGMDQHHHETGRNTQPVQKHYPLFLYFIHHFLSLRIDAYII